MNGFKNLIVFTIVSLVLIGPFIIKIGWPSREIYPSVVMPAGAGKISIGEEGFTFKKTEICCVSLPDRKYQLLNNSQLTNPAPVQYLSAFIKAEFGLDTKNEMLQMEGKEWWRNKLRESGCLDSVIILLTKQIETGNLSERVIDEKHINLY